jgi:hypothetical protein
MHVPLERRSTARIGLSLLGAVVLPLTILMVFLGYLMWQFGNAFGGLLNSLPF